VGLSYYGAPFDRLAAHGILPNMSETPLQPSYDPDRRVPDRLRSTALTVDRIPEVKELIYEHLGNLRIIAERLGRSRTVVKDYISRHVELVAALDEVQQGVIDQAEYNFATEVMNGDLKASQFILSTKGRERGYVTRGEITGANGEPVGGNEVQVVFVKANPPAQIEESRANIIEGKVNGE
jgi:hypothetical protein